MDYFEYLRGIRSASLSSKAKIVALMIASHYDFKTEVPAYPSLATIATESCLSVRSVIRARAELIEKGWLVSHRQYNNANLSVPSVPQSQGVCHSGSLNTHINTQLNTHLNNKEDDDSNESSLVNLIKEIEPEGTITLDTNETTPLAEEGWGEATPPLETRSWKQKQEDEHNRLLKLADELWG